MYNKKEKLKTNTRSRLHSTQKISKTRSAPLTHVPQNFSYTNCVSHSFYIRNYLYPLIATVINAHIYGAGSAGKRHASGNACWSPKHKKTDNFPTPAQTRKTFQWWRNAGMPFYCKQSSMLPAGITKGGAVYMDWPLPDS